MIPHITGFTLETFVVISDRGLQFPQGNRVSVVWLMGYYDEAQASLCKFADLLESSLSAHEILILIALSSNYTCTNVQTHQSLRPEVNRTNIAICGSTQDFGTVTKNRLRSRLDFRPNWPATEPTHGWIRDLDPAASKNPHKAIDFLVNTGTDPLENHKATQQVFWHWRAICTGRKFKLWCIIFYLGKWRFNAILCKQKALASLHICTGLP